MIFRLALVLSNPPMASLRGVVTSTTTPASRWSLLGPISTNGATTVESPIWSSARAVRQAAGSFPRCWRKYSVGTATPYELPVLTAPRRGAPIPGSPLFNACCSVAPRAMACWYFIWSYKPPKLVAYPARNDLSSLGIFEPFSGRNGLFPRLHKTPDLFVGLSVVGFRSTGDLAHAID